MSYRIVFTAVAAALLASSVGADDVYLKSGGVFEDVVAVVTEAQVRIVLPIGEMVIPASEVLHVEVADSALAEYFERRDRLDGHAATKAEEWLDLASWSRVRGLDKGHREAALQAARLAPNLEGLAPVMRSLDYVFEPELEHWLPYADAMHRRGLVQLDGEWINREERDRRLAAWRHESAPSLSSSDAGARSREAPDEVALAQVDVMRDMVAVMARQQTATATLGTAIYPSYGLPRVSYGTFAHGGNTRPVPQAVWNALSLRQSGSMIPVRSFVVPGVTAPARPVGRPTTPGRLPGSP